MIAVISGYQAKAAESDWMTNYWLWWNASAFSAVPSVLWCCWFDARKGIRPVKNWVVGCWCGCVWVKVHCACVCVCVWQNDDSQRKTVTVEWLKAQLTATRWQCCLTWCAGFHSHHCKQILRPDIYQNLCCIISEMVARFAVWLLDLLKKVWMLSVAVWTVFCITDLIPTCIFGPTATQVLTLYDRPSLAALRSWSGDQISKSYL